MDDPIPSGADPATPVWRPVEDAPPAFGAVPSPQPPSAVEDGPVAAPATSPTDALEPDEDPALVPEPRSQPYTWLHLVVLVAVAFVLGMLIIMVVNQDARASAEALAVLNDVVGPGGAPTEVLTSRGLDQTGI